MGDIRRTLAADATAHVRRRLRASVRAWNDDQYTAHSARWRARRGVHERSDRQLRQRGEHRELAGDLRVPLSGGIDERAGVWRLRAVNLYSRSLMARPTQPPVPLSQAAARRIWLH